MGNGKKRWDMKQIAITSWFHKVGVHFQNIFSLGSLDEIKEKHQPDYKEILHSNVQAPWLYSFEKVHTIDWFYAYSGTT